MPRTITLTFDDGTTAVYQNAPDNITPADVEARAAKDFGKKITGIDGGRKTAPAPTREQESNAELARLNQMVAERGAPADGMPAPRAPSGFEQTEFYQRTKNAPEILGDVVRPFDVGKNIGTMAQQAAEFGKAGSERFMAGLSGGRPLDVVTGAGQNLLGGAGIAFAPLSGLTKTFVADPLARTFGRDVGERAQVVADIAAGPSMITAAAKPIVGAGNMLVGGANIVQDIFRPKMNWLGEAVGEQGSDIVSALRASKSGVEGAGQAASPAGSVPFSQFTKELEKHASQIAKDATATQDALLTARANIAEGRAAEGSRKLANVVAAPDEQNIGAKLTKIAEKEKKDVREKVIDPKANEYRRLGGNETTDLSEFVSEAEKVIDSVGVSGATPIAKRISNLKNNQATLQDIDEMRAAINREAAKTKANGDALGYSDLMKLHKKLDEAVVNSATLPQNAIVAYKDFLKTYADQYARRFKDGLQFDLFKIKQGENRIKPEDFITKFMAGPTETDQFVAMLGSNSEAMNYARQGMEGLFRKAAIKNGKIDVDAVDEFLTKYGAQIDKLDANGLSLRNKFTALKNETARISAPEARVVDVRGAVTAKKLPEGVSAEKVTARVDELVKATSAEDLTALRDAIQIARRRADFEARAATPKAKEFKLPAPAPQGIDFLNWTYRIPMEVFRGVTGRLTTKAAQDLGEVLSDPKRLNEAADLIEKAIAIKARQTGRKFGTVTAPAYAGVPSAINALAPPNQNNLAGQ
jgi:hypothetical protein